MVAAVTLTIIGNRTFFDRTNQLRNDLKDIGGDVVVDEQLDESVREPGLITVERAEPNPQNHVLSEIIHVVDAAPDFEERTPATQASKEGLAIGVTYSIQRPDLDKAIRSELRGVAGDYIRAA